jgi:hypothetical protein
MRRPLGALLTVLLLAVVLGACGNSTKKSTSPATSPGLVAKATAGMNACAGCHTAVTTDWLTSRHANAEGGLDSAGTPDLNYSGSPSGDCAPCHDPLGDSARLVAGYTGSTPRPVVGCESCHGGGSQHVAAGGAGSIDFVAYTDMVIGTTSTLAVSGQFMTCTGCHALLDSSDPVNTASTVQEHGSSTTSDQVIWDTHFATPSDFSGTGSANTKTIGGYAMNYADAKVCTNCHNPHKKTIDIMQEWSLSAHGDRTSNYSSNLATQDKQGYFSGAWAHYNWSCDGLNSSGCGTSSTTNLPNSRIMCQRCHTTSGFAAYATALADGDTTLASAMRSGTTITGSVPAVTYASDWKPEMLKCNGCHKDNKGTVRNPGAITADYSYLNTTSDNVIYTVANASFTYPDAGNSNVCLTCHTGRESGETIKNLSLTTSPSITTFTNLSFINSHYLTAGGTVFTATGYEYTGRSYDNPSSYMHNQIGMSNFKSTGTSGPCIGCHMSRPNKNGNHLFLPVSRHNPVRYADGTVSVTAGSTVVTGASTTWLSTVNAASDRFLGPDAREYVISSVDSDTQITLTSAFRGSTASGAAYGIMTDGERIAGIASEVCFNCHAGTSSMLMDMLNQDRTLYEESIDAVIHALDKRGISFKPSNPYFFTKRSTTGTVAVTNGSTIVTGTGTLFSSASISTRSDKFRVYDGGLYDIQTVNSDTQITLKAPYLGATASGLSYAIVTSTSQKNWDPDGLGDSSARNTLGAAFNLNLIEHDPGAYVHNRTYIRRLLYDALDWIDDYDLNYSVGKTLNALGDEPYKAGAIEYLLPNGTMTGVSAERP